MEDEKDADLRERIRRAAEKYAAKENPARKKRHNNSPERDLQKEIIKWLNSIGWAIDNVDSKASYSLKAGSYISQNHAQAGFADIVGNDTEGHSVYIELKAPGRRNTLRENQREFLLKKINTNCFAIVADSKEYIQNAYAIWSTLDADAKKKFLLDSLPKEKSIDDSPLFP